MIKIKIKEGLHRWCENDRVKTYKNPLLHKRHEKLLKKKKNENQHFRTLELTNGLQQSGECLLKKNLLNLRNRELCGIFLLPYSQSIYASSMIALKTTALQSGENQQLGSHWRKNNRIGGSSKSNSRQFSLLNQSGSSLDDSVCKTIFILTDCLSPSRLFNKNTTEWVA